MPAKKRSTHAPTSRPTVTYKKRPHVLTGEPLHSRLPSKTSRRRLADPRRLPALLGRERASARFRPRALACSRLFGRLGPVVFGALSHSGLRLRGSGASRGLGLGVTPVQLWMS